MNEFRARIGRVRMKAGGADVVVLDSLERSDIAAELIGFASEYADDTDPDSELCGYVLIAYYSDDAKAMAYHRPDGVPTELFPAMVEELVRRRTVTQAEACNVVNRSNGFDV